MRFGDAEDDGHRARLFAARNEVYHLGSTLDMPIVEYQYRVAHPQRPRAQVLEKSGHLVGAHVCQSAAIMVLAKLATVAGVRATRRRIIGWSPRNS